MRNVAIKLKTNMTTVLRDGLAVSRNAAKLWFRRSIQNIRPTQRFYSGAIPALTFPRSNWSSSRIPFVGGTSKKLLQR